MNKREYASYDEYIAHQIEKTSNPKIRRRLHSDRRAKVGIFQKYFGNLKRKGLFVRGDDVLCLGARMGEEVEAMVALGIGAIGIDLIPHAPYVFECDFHHLDRLGRSYNVVYTNAFDHAFDVELLCSSVMGVLKDNGLFIIDLLPNSYANYESIEVVDIGEIVEAIESHGFEFIREISSQCRKGWKLQVFKRKGVQRKFFIDCGGHVGESIKLFKESGEYDDSFRMFSFEPLPNSANQYKRMDGIGFFRMAVWIENGESNFYTDNKQITWGSTLLDEKTTSVLDKNNPLTVKTMDFSTWLQRNFSAEDYIVVKMDIEGAEYKVLSKMIDDGSIKHVDKLFVEWHWDRMDMDEQEHSDLVHRLGEIEGLELLPEMSKFFG